jgi:hypothetical protein
MIRCITWTIVVVIGGVFRSRAILCRSHYIVSLLIMLSRSWLRCVSECQASRINNSIVAYKSNWHLSWLTNLSFFKKKWRKKKIATKDLN